MRRWVLFIVIGLVALPLGWWGYKALQPKRAMRIEHTVASSILELKREAPAPQGFSLANATDLVSIGSGIVGIAAFFREKKTKKRSR